MTLPNTTEQPLDSLAIDVDEAFGIEFGRYQNLNVFCPWCEQEGASSSPSCSVSVGGIFSCKSCGKSGTAQEFYAKRTGNKTPPKRKTKRKRANQHRPRPITQSLADQCHQLLLDSPVEMTYLAGRGISRTTVVQFCIGKDETRLTIPIYDRQDNLYGIRRYMPMAKRVPKMVKHEGGQGSPILYPAAMLVTAPASEAPYLMLVEGEWDCLLAIQSGFEAVTVTSGVTTWDAGFTNEIAAVGKPVVIVYDVNDSDDDLGQRVAWQRALDLHAAGIQCKILRLPLPPSYVGGDITNYLADEKHTADDMRKLIADTPWFAPEVGMNDNSTAQPRVLPADPAPMEEATLFDAAKAAHIFKMIRLRCLVAGKATSPYLVPSKISVEVEDTEGTKYSLLHEFDPYDSVLLSLINCPTITQRKLIKSILGLDEKSSISITVLEAMNIEEIFIIPAIDSEGEQGPYVLRQAFFIGHGLETNRVYNFEGYTLPNPRTQVATHIMIRATPSDTDLDNYHLTDEQVVSMRKTFSTEDAYVKMEHIADFLASNVTRIYGRLDLHVAIDLVFHSPLQFDFDGTRIRKGWLECLIIGDTRTGKGCVTEGLVKYYGVGEVVSGENLSFAGLIGGIDKVGDTHTLVWGKIPLNDKRLVVMDECGALPLGTIGKLSRVRSEGIAEVTKIKSEKTTARTRLIWLSNPRPAAEGRPVMMHDYAFGIEAAAELIGAAEDVSRFDYVLTVAQNEVPSAMINKHHAAHSNGIAYPPDLCRSLIVWAWSRRPEDITFSTEATQLILTAAMELGRQFTPKICLVQSEDIRYKLARIAAAAACRTFSSPDGVKLEVTTEHVSFAYNFIHHIYSKTSCGYLQMSQQEMERSTLANPKAVYEALSGSGAADTISLVDYFLDNRHITMSDLCDFTGIDIMQARTVLSALIKERAIVKEHNNYIKRPSFRLFLQDAKMRLVGNNGQHITEWDEIDASLATPNQETA